MKVDSQEYDIRITVTRKRNKLSAQDIEDFILVSKDIEAIYTREGVFGYYIDFKGREREDLTNWGDYFLMRLHDFCVQNSIDFDPMIAKILIHGIAKKNERED